MRGWLARGHAPVDIASLAVFRVAFGLAMMVAVGRFFANGWIHEYYLVPKHFFHYWGFAWVRPWPGCGMYLHYGAMGVAALFLTVGLWYRASAIAFFVLFTYAHLIDKTNYLNHYYLVSCLSLLLVFLPLDRALSVRVWRRPQERREVVPAWCLWVLRFQVGCVYFFAGVAKLKLDWLVYAQPLTVWLGANTEFPVVGRLFHSKLVAYAFSWAGALFDLTIVGWLSWRRSRLLAYGALAGFHFVTARLFQLGMFPWIMSGAALVFFEPGWPRPALERLGLLRKREVSGVGEPRTKSVAKRLAWREILLGVYVGVQVLMPLRHWLYPGNVLWTEQGFRFSWSVMLMEKNGAVEVTIEDPRTGARSTIEPSDYLTRYQTKMMATQPDMLLEFAHLVADDYARRESVAVRVYVEALVALNGRRPQPMIDPRVDLAGERDTLGPKRWVLPMATHPPEL